MRKAAAHKERGGQGGESLRLEIRTRAKGQCPHLPRLRRSKFQLRQLSKPIANVNPGRFGGRPPTFKADRREIVGSPELMCGTASSQRVPPVGGLKVELLQEIVQSFSLKPGRNRRELISRRLALTEIGHCSPDERIGNGQRLCCTHSLAAFRKW